METDPAGFYHPSNPLGAQMADGKRLVRIPTAARIWGVSRQAIHQSIAAGKTEVVEIDGTKFVEVSEDEGQSKNPRPE